MAYDPNATGELLMDGECLDNWVRAAPGQWFIGVLDTNYKKVYILPIEPGEGEGAATNTGDRNRNRYASGALKFDPRTGTEWPTVHWRGCAPDWYKTAPGATTHHKIMIMYKCTEEDCLGFTLIKLDKDGKFALMKLTSNSLNTRIDSPGPGHSFARATAVQSRKMPVYNNPADNQRHGLPYNDPHEPGKANYLSGTNTMPTAWREALKSFLGSGLGTGGIEHIAMSLD
jgi:hypothetical protein